MTVSGRFTLLTSLTAVCSAFILVITFAYQTFEQRKVLWSSVLEARIATDPLLPSTLHFRNPSLAIQHLNQLNSGFPLDWSMVLHVDGEILAVHPTGKEAVQSPLLERSGTNRLETLMAIQRVDNLEPGTHGKPKLGLSQPPLMLLVSVPVLSSIDPLRTDIGYNAYQARPLSNDLAGARYVNGYIEQGVFLGDFLFSMLGDLLPAVALILIIVLLTLFVIRVHARSLGAPLLHMARVAEAIDAEELPNRIELPPGYDENIVRITNVLNSMVDGLRQARTRLDVDRSLMGLRVDSTARKLDKAEAEIDKTRHQIHRVSYFDPVTGLANRRLMLEHMSLLIQIAARERRHLGIVLLDISDIRKIQEAKGRETADTVLRQLATRLARRVRESDVISHEPLAQDIARFDGDEFCVVMHGIYEADGAVAGAKRLLEELETPILVGGENITLKSCAGVAIAPIHARSPEDLVRAADVALSTARFQNNRQVALFDSDMDKRGSERFQLEADLRNADFDQEFYLVYQPQINPVSGDVVGMEALLRWRHPQRGEVPPSRFISIAEQTGQMTAIGSWVLRRACADFNAMCQVTPPPPRVSVNVSTAQFDERFVDFVKGTIEEYGLMPRQLGLELTESILVGSVDQAISHLKTLHEEVGIHISIDDFGTGYSSLAYLSRLPIDELKVDRSFVLAMESDPSAIQLTEAIVAIARKMHLSVIVEGVETAAQLALIKAMGVDGIQGYYFSKPLTLGDMGAFLENAGQI